MIIFILYILTCLFSYTFSIIPNWNFENSSINLFGSETSYSYLVSHREIYNIYLEQYKNLTIVGNNIIELNKFTYKNYTEDNYRKYYEDHLYGPIFIEFDNIESVYNQYISGKVICPKGKYHLYGIDQKDYIIPNDFIEKGDWELKCYMHKSKYFLLFYEMNGDTNFFWTTTNYSALQKKDGFFGEELFDFILQNKDKDSDKTTDFSMASLIKQDNYLVLKAGIMRFSDNDITFENTGNLNITYMKEHTKAVFQNYSTNFYFLTYNNASDFICGYSTKQPSTSEGIKFKDINEFEFKIFNESPFEFKGDVEILEISFSLYNKYAIYKIYDKESNKTYNGFIDVTKNKVMFNTDIEIKKFIAYDENSMLAITNTGAYQICGIISNDGKCTDSCADGQSIILDTDGNKCGSVCPGKKIKLLPGEICYDECDLNINIKNGTLCGLCKYFSPFDEKYKIYSDKSMKCYKEIPSFAEFNNTNLNLLKCKEGWTFDEEVSTCIECLNKTKYKCKACSNRSNKYNLCLSCNEGFIKVNYTEYQPEFLDCVKEDDPLLKKYYKDNITNEYRPCYKTCKNCTIGGDRENNNCLACKNGYMPRPGQKSPYNCVSKSNYYYRDSYGQFKAMNYLQCPEEAKFIIESTNSCIDDCKKDNVYKYLFNGHCYENCSVASTFSKSILRSGDDDKNKFECLVDPRYCSLGKNKLYLRGDDLGMIEILVKAYISEFFYTEKHISLYDNENYAIMIYKYNSTNCIKDLGLKMPIHNFKSCYKKVQDEYNISESLIVVNAEKKELKNPTTLHSFYHPKSGLKLDAGKICAELSISIEENLKNFLDEDYKHHDFQVSLLEQGINIFDLNDPFFNDICFDFDNPLKKDIPLSDRIKELFPNATTCDKGCQANGIDFEELTVSCDCSFRDLSQSEIIENNEFLEDLLGEALEFIQSSNIMVLKCSKYMFKHFVNSIGALISLVLIIGHITMTLLYFLIDIGKMKKYVFSLTNNYLTYIKKHSKNNKYEPPKKNHIKNRDSNDILICNKSEDKKSIISYKGNSRLQLETKKNQGNKIPIFHNKIRNSKKSQKSSRINKRINDLKTHKESEKFFEDYMSTSPDEMAYDDAKVKDNRTFRENLFECIVEKQDIANTFFSEDHLNPRTIKIIVWILNIMLYFVVNGLLYSEEVISEIYNADENEENFFSFFLGSIEGIIYSTFVGLIIDFLIDFFFVDEGKIKGIFRREKHNSIILRKNITELLNNIKKRYIAFISVASFLFIFSFYYLLCFNYVYPYTQIEWIKSSIMVVIIMQLLSLLKCLYESGLRALSFKLESEKLYKASKLFD